MYIRNFALIAALGGALIVSSCSKKSDVGTADSTVRTDSTAQSSASNPVLVPATNSPVAPNVKTMIVSPREGQVIENTADSVRIVMQISGMQLAAATPGDSIKGIAYSKQGQHVHIIVDDKPYMADYTNGQPFNVGVLAPGKHVIRAFPSRSWHESVKQPAAFAVREFYVGPQPKDPKTGRAAIDSSDFNPHTPFITYSRPKGSYTGSEGDSVLLDFFVTNTKLSPTEDRVKVWADGKEIGTITEWKPYYITGLGKGKHTIHVELEDAKGAPIPGKYNSPQQEITVQ